MMNLISKVVDVIKMCKKMGNQDV